MTLTVSGDEAEQKVQKIQELLKKQTGISPNKSEAVRVALRKEVARLKNEVNR